jgi:hypothetical protein
LGFVILFCLTFSISLFCNFPRHRKYIIKNMKKFRFSNLSIVPSSEHSYFSLVNHFWGLFFVMSPCACTILSYVLYSSWRQFFPGQFFPIQFFFGSFIEKSTLIYNVKTSTFFTNYVSSVLVKSQRKWYYNTTLNSSHNAKRINHFVP